MFLAGEKLIRYDAPKAASDTLHVPESDKVCRPVKIMCQWHKWLDLVEVLCRSDIAVDRSRQLKHIYGPCRRTMKSAGRCVF